MIEQRSGGGGARGGVVAVASRACFLQDMVSNQHINATSFNINPSAFLSRKSI